MTAAMLGARRLDVADYDRAARNLAYDLRFRTVPQAQLAAYGFDEAYPTGAAMSLNEILADAFRGVADAFPEWLDGVLRK